MKTLHIQLADEVHKELKMVALKRGTTIKGMVEGLVLNRYTPAPRLVELAEAIDTEEANQREAEKNLPDVMQTIQPTQDFIVQTKVDNEDYHLVPPAPSFMEVGTSPNETNTLKKITRLATPKDYCKAGHYKGDSNKCLQKGCKYAS